MNEIMKFSSIDIDGTKYDIESAYKDYFNHYRSENKLTNKVLSYDNSFTLAEKDKKMHKLMVKCIEDYSNQKKTDLISYEAYAMNPVVKHATYAVVSAFIDFVLPDTLIESIGMYTDARFSAFGDNFNFTIKPRNLFTVSQVGRGKRKAFIQKQFDTTVSLSPVNHSVTVEVALYKVLSGKESLAEFTAKAIKAIESQVTYDAYDALNSAFTAATFPNELKTTGYTYSTAIDLAQRVSAWNGGNKAIFVGTQLALANILPDNANYRYLLESDYVKMGYVKTIGNIDTLVLPQIADYTSSTFGLKIDNKKIYVICPTADKIIKLGFEGSTLSYTDEQYANANLTQSATFQKSWDAQVVTAAVIGVINVA